MMAKKDIRFHFVDVTRVSAVFVIAKKLCLIWHFYCLIYCVLILLRFQISYLTGAAFLDKK